MAGRIGGRLMSTGFKALVGTFILYTLLTQVTQGSTSGAGKWIYNQLPHAAGAASAALLQEYSSKTQLESGEQNTLQNKQSTSGKRISDDAQKQQQLAGFANQAINLLGQAMSPKG